MMRWLEWVVRWRNPEFRLSPDVRPGLLLAFGWQQAGALARGARVLWRGRRPQGMLLGRGVRFFGMRQMRWGRFLKLGDGVYCSALGREGITFGDRVSIGAYSRVIVSTTLNDPGQYIRIGHRVGIGEFAYLGGAGGLSIGDDCIMGQYVSFHPENHVFDDPDRLIRLQGVTRAGITLGRDCWVGSKATFLSGVTLGDGCVVAAGAVVTRSFPAGSVVGGVPARLLRERPDYVAQSSEPELV